MSLVHPTRRPLSAPVRVVVVGAVSASLTLLVPAVAHADPVGGGRLGTHGVVVAPGTKPLPDVAAESWVVADATTGAVLAAKYPHLRHRPASTLKTLTSITLMPRLDPAAEHTVTTREMAPVYGSRAGIVAGATYTVDDLWHALLLPSGNDAAAALAGAYGGIKKTVRAMNAKAAELQAKDTHAVNPSGLDADGQYTSAYDMALFARAAIAMPEFTRVSGTVSYDLPGAMPKKPGKKRSTFKIYGENRLLNHGYKGVIAGKTGYTTLAGRTFWVAAKRHGHTVIVTLMGIGESTETAAEKLMTWGLANDPVAAPVGVLVDPVEESAAAPGGPSAAPTGPEGAGSGVAAAGAATQPASSSGTGLLLLGLLLLAVVAVVAFEMFWRRRRRGRADGQVDDGPGEVPAPAAAPVASMDAAPAPLAEVPPATRPEPAAPTGSVVVRPPDPQPSVTEADPGPAERARPAPVEPTGNVRVVRPPSRPD